MPERRTMPLQTFRAAQNIVYDNFSAKDGLPKNWKKGIGQGAHGASGFVRVHHPIRDFFRRYISFPEWNLLNNNGGPKTFNRGSLIDYLNTEIGHLPQGEGEEALQPLSKGWLGGLIGGTSDDRIRQVYARVFNFYQQVDQEALNKLAIERPILASNLKIAPVIAENELSIIFLDHHANACQRIFEEGKAKVTLNRYSHKEAQDECKLIIEIEDPALAINELMQWITGLLFTGTLNPIFIISLQIRYIPPAHLALPQEEIQSRTQALVNAIQEWQQEWQNE